MIYHLNGELTDQVNNNDVFFNQKRELYELFFPSIERPTPFKALTNFQNKNQTRKK